MTKEKKKEYNKKYNIENKEKMKEYREAHKDKIKEYSKKYRLENKEKAKEYHKEYSKKYNKTETGKKNITISAWIQTFKIKFVDRNEAEFYYNSYINTHRCTWCDKMFKDSSDRHLDHCHTCGLPRAIICRSCNTKDLVPCVSCLL